MIHSSDTSKGGDLNKTTCSMYYRIYLTAKSLKSSLGWQRASGKKSSNCSNSRCRCLNNSTSSPASTGTSPPPRSNVVDDPMASSSSMRSS